MQDGAAGAAAAAVGHRQPWRASVQERATAGRALIRFGPDGAARLLAVLSLAAASEFSVAEAAEAAPLTPHFSWYQTKTHGE